MTARCTLFLAALLLAAPARGAERSASFQVALRLVRAFTVGDGSVGPPATRVERAGAGASVLRVTPLSAPAGAAVLAGAPGAIQVPCGERGCKVPLLDGVAPAAVVLTVLPDGGPVALFER